MSNRWWLFKPWPEKTEAEKMGSFAVCVIAGALFLTSIIPEKERPPRAQKKGEFYSEVVNSAPKIDRIDADQFVAGLPLASPEMLESGNGRKKTLWKIEGTEYSNFEIIGDDQRDADQVGWQCRIFDAAGNSIPPGAPDHFCHRLFVTVLSRLTDDAGGVANRLIQATLRTGTTADATIGDFSVDTMDGFYFVRRISRYDRSR